MFALWAEMAPVMGLKTVMQDVTLWAFTQDFFEQREAELAEFEEAMATLPQPLDAYLAQLSSIQTHDATARLGRDHGADAGARGRDRHPDPGRALATPARGRAPAPSGRRFRAATPALGAPGPLQRGRDRVRRAATRDEGESHEHADDRSDALARSYLNGHIDRASFLRRAAALGLAVSGAGTFASAAAAAGSGTLQAALTGEPDMLDPTRSQIYTGAQVYDNIFSKLIDIDEHQKFYGVLAKSWKQVEPEDVGLRPRAGREVPQRRRLHRERREVHVRADPEPEDRERLRAAVRRRSSSVEVNSPTRVTFHLSTPFGPFLTNLANNGEIVNKRSIEAKGSERKPVGTGPFQFVEWKQGDHITLKRFPGYFKQGQPSLDGVVVPLPARRPGPHRRAALRPAGLGRRRAAAAARHARQGPAADACCGSKLAGIPDYLALNVRKTPFDNVALRQAVAYAIDRDEIRAVAYYGAGEDGLLEVPTGSSGTRRPTRRTPKPDLTKAKAKMKEAGLSGGITVKYLGLPQYPELLKTGEVVKEQLAKIGIDMAIQQVDVSVWFDHFSKGTYQITSAYQERTLDPDNFYSLVLKSGAAINASGYKNPAVDKLIEQAAATTNMAKRKALYSKIRKQALGRRADHLHALRDDQLRDAQEHHRLDDQPDARAAARQREADVGV